MTRLLLARRTAALVATTLLFGCGGGGTHPSAATGVATTSNVQAVSVDAGPTGQFPNMLTTSVTICVPGTNTCQTIADVQVDTGSSGLRLLASAITIPLPSVAATGGGTYSECVAFADGTAWGALATADVRLADETASSMSLQLIQDNGAGAPVPPSCSAQGAPENSLAALGANGVLGVGIFLQDCGAYCASVADNIYYTCTSGGVCAAATIPLALQLNNPVAFFAQDNNGVIVQLPAIAATGATPVAGNLIFGIGTQSNNTLTGTPIGVPVAGAGAGVFTATYAGTTFANGFLDSGSTELYFNDATLPTCSATSPLGDLSSFYCPGVTTALSAIPISLTLTGSNGNSVAATASVANAQFLFSQMTANLDAFDDLAGPAGAVVPNAFDLGAPFFFGRSVFTAFEQRTTTSGSGPFFALQPNPVMQATEQAEPGDDEDGCRKHRLDSSPIQVRDRE